MTPASPAEPVDEADWQATRAYLREHRPDLTVEAVRLYPDHLRAGASLLLARPEWTPDQPIPLDVVTLEPITDVVRPAAALLTAAAGVLPVGYAGTQATYADAVHAIERPRLLENRYTYRLSGADLRDDGGVLRFGGGEYFDVLNVGEAAAHEYARARQRGVTPAFDELPLRALVGDPTDPARRPILTAVTTLTVRLDRDRDEARFLVHWRDPAKVATNAGYYQVAPVGMFQPAGDSSTRLAEDFDVWRCIAREFSEELLGAPEHADVEYESWPFFQALEDARSAGTCRPYLVGVGVDPLTFATDILTVAVFDASAFDELFAGLVEENAEGRTTVRDAAGLIGTRLDAQSVGEMVGSGRMQPAGAATLDLAWRHRAVVLSR
jgi:hypothetical protein